MSRWKRVVRATALVAVAVVIGGVALIARGFRANSTPSALEVAVARTVRNLAIPGQARNERNPLHISPENLQAGRDRFLASLATGHGNDGDGRSTIGHNLYPRATNLRSSNGEIRSKRPQNTSSTSVAPTNVNTPPTIYTIGKNVLIQFSTRARSRSAPPLERPRPRTSRT